MPIADAHVDVLWKLISSTDSFYGESTLQASFEKLSASNVLTQVFALFVDPLKPGTAQLEDVIRSIDAFEQQVVAQGKVRAVRTKRDLALARQNRELAALLSIEGGGCLRGQVSVLRVMHALGVQGMGLTWNHANELADGCREPRGGGLTGAGREVISEMNRLQMWVDLAHLADKGVEDVFRLSTGPVMASHANSRAIQQHPRNLTDDTIRELIRRQGWMGFVFEGSFVGDEGNISVNQLCKHIDRVLQLGGENVIGFGSDFDGTSNFIPGLTDASDYAPFGELMQARYGEVLARKMLFENFEAFLNRVLPE